MFLLGPISFGLFMTSCKEKKDLIFDEPPLITNEIDSSNIMTQA
jgi:hypothetical protein